MPGEAAKKQTKQQEKRPEGRRQGEDERRRRSMQDLGESHNAAFGEGSAGGKIDSTQRDMGQTGQTMKSGATKSGERHQRTQQQGPYGPRERHRGPVATGKPLMDDWGKSDKH